MDTLETAIATRFNSLEVTFNERSLRLWAAAEALVAGRGGISAVNRATGISRTTIHEGIKELGDPEKLRAQQHRTRGTGGGRKKAVDINPNLQHEMGYSLHANRKTSESKQHPDRNEQFEFINLLIEENLEKGNPVISVDAKKKELVGNFKNAGKEWRAEGTPEKVNVYDFPSMAEGRATPIFSFSGIQSLRVEAHRVGRLKPLHRRHQIPLRRFQHKVIVIIHHRVGVYPHLRPPCHLPKRLQQHPPVVVIQHDATRRFPRAITW